MWTDGHKHDEINMLKMRRAPFWDITHHKVTIPYRRFGKTDRSHRQRSRNQSLLALLDHYRLRNIQEEHKSHLHRGRNPKSRLICPIMQLLLRIHQKKNPRTTLVDILEDSENIGRGWDLRSRVQKFPA